MTKLVKKTPALALVAEPPQRVLLCEYPNGHDGAPVCAGAPQAVPAGADVGQWRDMPSGVPIARLIEVNVRNGRAFESLRNQYLTLRDWANTQCYAP